MHVFNGFNQNANKEIKKVHYVVGKVEGPLNLEKGQKVIFAGNCTSWKGNINGQEVTIESSYKPPCDTDEKNTKSNDMLLKTVQTLWRCFKQRNAAYVHAKGCPVSVGDHVHYISRLGKIKNVNFDPRMVIPLNIAYWRMRIQRALNRMLLYFT